MDNQSVTINNVKRKKVQLKMLDEELETIKDYLKDEITEDNLGKERYKLVKSKWSIDELADIAECDHLARIVFSLDDKKAWIYGIPDNHKDVYNGFLAMLFDSDVSDYEHELGFSENEVKAKVDQDKDGDNEDVYAELFSNCDTLELSPYEY